MTMNVTLLILYEWLASPPRWLFRDVTRAAFRGLIYPGRADKLSSAIFGRCRPPSSRRSGDRLLRNLEASVEKRPPATFTARTSGPRIGAWSGPGWPENVFGLIYGTVVPGLDEIEIMSTA